VLQNLLSAKKEGKWEHSPTAHSADNPHSMYYVQKTWGEGWLWLGRGSVSATLPPGTDQALPPAVRTLPRINVEQRPELLLPEPLPGQSAHSGRLAAGTERVWGGAALLRDLTRGHQQQLSASLGSQERTRQIDPGRGPIGLLFSKLRIRSLVIDEGRASQERRRRVPG
jgi:hypothetical protein